MIETYLFTSSLREFLRFKRVFIWILLALAGMGLAALWPHLSRGATQSDTYSIVSMIFVFHALALASAIYTTAVVSQEVEQKTIVYLLTRPVARWKLIIFRYLASCTVVAILGVVGTILVSMGVYGMHFSANTFFVKDCIALIIGSFAYGALFLLVSLLFNRAMIFCLLFAFGWETSVPSMPGEMYRLSIFSQMQAIAERTNSGSDSNGVLSGGLSSGTLTAGTAYATLLVLIVVLVSFSAVWFSKFEFVPREDAE